MRSRLSLIIVACLAVVSTLAASGCANSSANSNGANAAQTTAADQSAAQPSAQGAAANNAAAGQAATPAGGASAPGPSGRATAANASGAGREVDACALLTSDDIKSVQGEAVKESKPSRRDDQSLRVSQCFFTTATFNKSVSLEVTTSADGRSARRFWDERFERAREEAGKGEKEREREKKERDADRKKEGARGEEDEEGALPAAVKGIGDEAYWAASRVNGTLYARRGDAFVRVSVGGSSSDEDRLGKAKALAQKALARL
jgi:hypothetical protein